MNPTDVMKKLSEPQRAEVMQTLRRGTIKLALTQAAVIATETTAEGAATGADPPGESACAWGCDYDCLCVHMYY